MLSRLSAVALLVVAAAFIFRAQTPRPEFKPGPEVPPMPKALMKIPRSNITRAKFPAVDFHLHGRSLQTDADYRKLIAVMDQTGIGVISNMDGGFGKAFDRNMLVGEAYRDRVLHFARLNYEGINEPGWSDKATAELERCFRAGAHGLKIAKELGLTFRNRDGSYIQADDPRFDSIWELCARYNKPVMIHISDSYGRFLPIGPETSATRRVCGAPAPTATITGRTTPLRLSSRRRARTCTPGIPAPAS